MSNPLLYKFVVNGVDVSAYVFKADHTTPNNQLISSGTIYLKRKVTEVMDVSNLLISKNVTIQRAVS